MRLTLTSLIVLTIVVTDHQVNGKPQVLFAPGTSILDPLGAVLDLGKRVSDGIVNVLFPRLESMPYSAGRKLDLALQKIQKIVQDSTEPEKDEFDVNGHKVPVQYLIDSLNIPYDDDTEKYDTSHVSSEQLWGAIREYINKHK